MTSLTTTLARIVVLSLLLLGLPGWIAWSLWIGASVALDRYRFVPARELCVKRVMLVLSFPNQAFSIHRPAACCCQACG